MQAAECNWVELRLLGQREAGRVDDGARRRWAVQLEHPQTHLILLVGQRGQASPRALEERSDKV